MKLNDKRPAIPTMLAVFNTRKRDLFTCKIVGWAMDSHMRTELVSRTLFMAVKTHKPEAGLIAHSDQGSQHAQHNIGDCSTSLACNSR